MCQKPVENRTCHLENDRAISSPSRLALHLRRSRYTVRWRSIASKSEARGQSPIFPKWLESPEAQSQRMNAHDDIPAFWKACGTRNQLKKSTAMWVSKNMNSSVHHRDVPVFKKNGSWYRHRLFLIPCLIQNCPIERCLIIVVCYLSLFK